MREKKLILFTAALCALAVLGFAVSGSRPEMEDNTERQDDLSLLLASNDISDLPELRRLDHSVDSFLRFWGIHGASLSISRNDSLLYAKGYGKAGKDLPMTPATKLRLASVSKLLTAVGIMRLVEEEKLSLNDKVFGEKGILSKYNPYIKDRNYRLITVEHLLRHQAGFTSRVSGDVMFHTYNFMKDWGLTEVPTSGFIVQKEVAKNLYYKPGTWQEYSNFGYLLLSLIIEEVSGKSYEHFMQEDVFRPAHCYGFAIAGNYEDELKEGETHYYLQPDTEPVPSFDRKYAEVEKCYGGNNITGLQGAGAWIGTTPELSRLMATIDARGSITDILSPESIEKMTRYYDDSTFGIGWIDCDQEGVWTRSGTFAGTSALIKMYPDGECWILVTNTSAWRGSKFTRNISGLFRQLRRRFSAKFPQRDLFQGN